MLGIDEFLGRLRDQISETEPHDLAQELEAPVRPVLIDVREGDEFRAGHIPGAKHISRGFLELKIHETVAQRDQTLVLYCAGGARSLLAAESLQRLGFERVISLRGGYAAWKGAGFPIHQPKSLNDDDRQRYARHLTIPEIGEAGQQRLLASRVVIVGTGGLGCPAAYYLAAAGIGTLGLIDFDTVDFSNLQRQILHTPDRVGQPKINSAVETLSRFNPNITLVPHHTKLTPDNVEALLGPYELIIDGTDNFTSRYLINDACVHLGKPLIHGSVFRFDGQVTVFDSSRGGACYRCLFPEPPPPGQAPSCNEAGVLGVLPGVIGLLQSVEAIKVLLGIGKPLVNRLLSYHALRGQFSEFQMERDPSCSVCAAERFPGYINYAQSCSS